MQRFELGGEGLHLDYLSEGEVESNKEKADAQSNVNLLESEEEEAERERRGEERRGEERRGGFVTH